MLSFSLWSIQGFGQQDCAKTLKKAQAAYDDGLLEKVPQMLTPCIKAEAFLEEDLVQAYKLMTLSYIFDERYEKADSAMQQFLKNDPEYQINTTTDPPEFVNLYNSFRTHPLISFGIVAGANMSFKNDIKQFGVYSAEANNTNIENSNIINYVAGLSVSYYFSKRLEANLEILAVGRNVESSGTALGLNNEGFASLTAKEIQTWMELPITAVYTFGNKKFKPYARLGGSIGFLLNSSIAFERTYTNEELPPLPSRSLDFGDQRYSTNFWLHGGLGFRYKIKNGHLQFDARYCHGLFNQTKVENRYSTEVAQDAQSTFYYTDNDFKISNVNVTLGFFQYLYVPKKLKKKK